MQNIAAAGPTSRPLTGRMVLIYLLAFFGTVISVNVFMARVAVSSFGGLETESSYKAGLSFKNDVAAAQAQDARHWAVDAVLQRDGGGATIVVSTRDATAQPLTGLSIEARLSHPIDQRNDMALTLKELEPGHFEGPITAPHGQWDLVIDVYRGAERVFRSKSRVTI